MWPTTESSVGYAGMDKHITLPRPNIRELRTFNQAIKCSMTHFYEQSMKSKIYSRQNVQRHSVNLSTALSILNRKLWLHIHIKERCSLRLDKQTLQKWLKVYMSATIKQIHLTEVSSTANLSQSILSNISCRIQQFRTSPNIHIAVQTLPWTCAHHHWN